MGPYTTNAADWQANRRGFIRVAGFLIRVAAIDGRQGDKLIQAYIFFISPAGLFKSVPRPLPIETARHRQGRECVPASHPGDCPYR